MKQLICFIISVASFAAVAQHPFARQLSEAAVSLTAQQVTYDPSYFTIAYPNGDVPAGKGVCTDVVIRAYRKLNIDLQKEVHKDMLTHFDKYPKSWGLKKPNSNIDHRRVPNLMVFFARHGTVKAISGKAEDYAPGDIVCWKLGGGITHIGLVVDKRSADNTRWMIVHNIGGGQVLADCLFSMRSPGITAMRPIFQPMRRIPILKNKFCSFQKLALEKAMKAEQSYRLSCSGPTAYCSFITAHSFLE